MIQGPNHVQIKISQLNEEDCAVGATFLIAEKALNQCVLKSVERKR
jgi:hypothetical protein